jgi:hypothetical protein
MPLGCIGPRSHSPVRSANNDYRLGDFMKEEKHDKAEDISEAPERIDLMSLFWIVVVYSGKVLYKEVLVRAASEADAQIAALDRYPMGGTRAIVRCEAPAPIVDIMFGDQDIYEIVLGPVET